MGFPKPWPTEWPDPHQDPDRDWRNPEEEPTRSPDREEEPARVPELQMLFRSVTWAVNHACNLHCTHCYDAVPLRRIDLNTGDALEMIRRLGVAGVRYIAFSGGEAFLRTDLLRLMEECVRIGIGFGARSNGTLISPGIAARLKDLGIAVVGVSFDGATQDSHDAVRGSGSFEASLAGVKALTMAGIKTQMEVVLSRANIDEATRFISLGEEVGVAEVNFSAMAPVGRGKMRASDLLDHRSWERVIGTLRSASISSVAPVTPNCALAGPCVANIEPHITCDGWLTPCYLSAHKLLYLLSTPPGSIRDYLARCRQRFQDVCGRRAWTEGQSLTGNLVQISVM